MKVHKENMERVTKMVAEEVQALKAQCDRERENAKIMKIEAERVHRLCYFETQSSKIFDMNFTGTKRKKRAGASECTADGRSWRRPQWKTSNSSPRGRVSEKIVRGGATEPRFSYTNVRGETRGERIERGI